MRRALLLALAMVTGLLALAVPRPASPEEPTFTGPAIVEEQASTAVLGVGTTATVDRRLNLLVTFAAGERDTSDRAAG